MWPFKRRAPKHIRDGFSSFCRYMDGRDEFEKSLRAWAKGGGEVVNETKGEGCGRGKTGEEFDAFLAELTELSRKHGIVLNACGNCESLNAYEALEQTGREYSGEFTETRTHHSRGGGEPFMEYIAWEWTDRKPERENEHG